jgi:transposase InsO family protein
VPAFQVAVSLSAQPLSLTDRDTPKDSPSRSGLDMHFWTAAEHVTVEWLKARLERRKWGEDAPPIPTHHPRTSENAVKRKFTFAEFTFHVVGCIEA